MGIQGWAIPNLATQYAYLALARKELSRCQLKQRRFTGAIGTEQTRDARGNVERELVDTDDVAVPLGNLVEFHDRFYLRRSSDFTRKLRMHTEIPKSTTSTNADHCQGCMGALFLRRYWLRSSAGFFQTIFSHHFVV